MSHPPRKDGRSRKLRIEPLEDRRLLAGVTVGNNLDVVNGITTSIMALIATPGADGISLREAILAANATAGADEITFAPSLSGQTITLLGGAQLDITDALTIDARPLAQNVTIDANLLSRVLRIDDPNTATESFAVTLAGLNFVNGRTTGSQPGGAIRSLTSGLLTLSESTVAGSRTADADGGGVWARNLRLERSTVSGNQTDGASASGGGVWATTLVVDQSTISGNSTVVDGGGAYVEEALSINQSTITLNAAGNRGAGVLRPNSAASFPLEVSGSLLAANTAPNAPDLRPGVGSVVMANYSLFSDATGSGVSAGTGTGNLLNISAQLGPLADNGGPTRTHGLLASSPAIDAGNPSGSGAPANDQRGAPFARIVDGDGIAGARTDIGAYELHRLVVDTNADVVDGNYGPGQFSLREAISLANAQLGAETITFAASLTSGGPATITLTQGQLSISDALTLTGPGATLLTIDASGNDPTPTVDNGDGSRVFNITNFSNGTLIDVMISGLTLTGGDVRGDGGAIASNEILTLANCVIAENHATVVGGGIVSTSESLFPRNSLTVRESTISNNRTSSDFTVGEGGGIRITRGFLIVDRSTISGNSSALAGGGISAADNNVDVQIRNSTISNNRLSTVDLFGIASNGGGLFLKDAIATISGSTISGNAAQGSGGGIFLKGGNALTVVHSTITDNQADADANGTGTGGGLSRESGSGSLILNQTIVAANLRSGAVADDILGNVTARYSLIGANTGATISDNGGNLIGTGAAPINPLLGPLADHGGPTQTRALLPGSPALDAGDPAVVFNAAEFDQRGFPFQRVVNGDNVAGARIDIGAYESQGIPGWPVGDYNRNGIADTADYTVWRDSLGQAGAGLPANGDNSGASANRIDQADYLVWRTNFGNTFMPVSSAAASAAIPVAIPTSATTVTSGTVSARREPLAPSPARRTELLLAARQTAFAELGEEVSATRPWMNNNSRASALRGERGVGTPIATLQTEHRGR